MPKRGYYPDQLSRKYDKVPEESELTNTEKQLKAADILEQNWDADSTLKSLSNHHDASSSMLSRVFDSFFGPVDDERTFEEIIKDVRAQLSKHFSQEDLTDTYCYNQYYKAKGEIEGTTPFSLKSKQKEATFPQSEDNEQISKKTEPVEEFDGLPLSGRERHIANIFYDLGYEDGIRDR